jgi:hypothetical protein
VYIDIFFTSIRKTHEKVSVFYLIWWKRILVEKGDTLLVETGIGEKGKGLLLMEMCNARRRGSSVSDLQNIRT